MADLLSREQAWERVARLASPLAETSTPLAEAVGRALTRDVACPLDLPPFDRSAMDGWALRAADTPGRLRVVGEVAAGAAPTVAVAPGTAQRIFTGGALPPGADAVERQEVVAVGDDGTIEVGSPVPVGLNVRRRGEDVPAGTLLLRAGEVVTAQALTALASAGLAAVPVPRRARVAVLVTGDELVPPGKALGPGQIHESNGIALRALVARAGAEPVDLGAAPDTPAGTLERVEAGLEAADVLLVAGGVSVGDHDHVRGAFAAAGVQERFWGVRIKPGKPLYCGSRGDRVVFGLPGNPLSAVCTFLVFVEPLLRRMHGEAGASERRIRVRVTRPIAPSDGRTTYLTATFAPGAGGIVDATPTEQQGSAMTLALARADGFVIAPDGGGEIPAGAEVDALPLGGWAAG